MADKCGLEVKDICVHEPSTEYKIGDEVTIDTKLVEHYCKKCGEFYK